MDDDDEDDLRKILRNFLNRFFLVVEEEGTGTGTGTGADSGLFRLRLRLRLRLLYMLLEDDAMEDDDGSSM